MNNPFESENRIDLDAESDHNKIYEESMDDNTVL